MDGFEVEPATLRAAGTAIEPIGAEVTAEARATAGLVQSAATGNPGFFVSEALGHAYAQIERAVRGAAADLRQYGANLGTTADRYTKVDQDAAASFRDIEGVMG